MNASGNNVRTCFTNSAMPANCCRPHAFYNKNLYTTVTSTVTVDSRMSLKESTWDVAWPSNISGSGPRMYSTRFSRYLCYNPPNSPSLSLCVAVLPGNYRMEAAVPPQHLTIAGSFCIHGSLEFPYRLRLDAKWERHRVHQVQPGGKPFEVGESTPCFLPVSRLIIIDRPQLSGIMSGATYLHELGVVHGDFKGVC